MDPGGYFVVKGQEKVILSLSLTLTLTSRELRLGNPHPHHHPHPHPNPNPNQVWPSELHVFETANPGSLSRI